MYKLLSCLTTICCAVLWGSTAQATAINVDIDGTQVAFDQVLSIEVSADPYKKPSGRTLVSGLSYWSHHRKFGSAGLEPDPVANYTASGNFDADYSTILVSQGMDQGLTRNGDTYTSKGVRDVKVALRDSAGADLLLLSSTSANNTYINGNRGGLFTYTLGNNGGAYVETLLRITGGSLANQLTNEALFVIMRSDAMHGQSSRDLYFSGLSFEVYSPAGTPPPNTEVPEPMSLSLLLSGLLGAGVRRKKSNPETIESA